MQQRAESPIVELIASVLWSIWKAWNKLIFQSRKPDPCESKQRRKIERIEAVPYPSSGDLQRRVLWNSTLTGRWSKEKRKEQWPEFVVILLAELSWFIGTKIALSLLEIEALALLFALVYLEANSDMWEERDLRVKSVLRPTSHEGQSRETGLEVSVHRTV